MNQVCFPEFGLNLDVPRIAFSIIGINIYWYSFFIVIGIVFALILSFFSKEKFGIKFDDVIDITIITLIAGIIGARLYYVLFNLNYYLASPTKLFALRDGGLAIYGGLIFGGLALIFRAKKIKINPYDFLDYIAPFVAIAQSIGRWGNFFNVEAYGNKTSNIFRMGINSIEGYIEVHPTFLYEGISTFVIFCLLRIMQKNRKFTGQILLLYLILYSFVRFFIEWIRADSLMIGYFKISMIVSFIIFVISITIYFKKNKHDK